MEQLPEGALIEVAAYFQVLAEPTRLQILNILRSGERNVGELAQMCGFTAANVSRHLALMTQQGLVERESRGTSAYYRIADPGHNLRRCRAQFALVRSIEREQAALARIVADIFGSP